GGGFDDPNNRGAKTFQEFQRQEAKIVSALKAIDADVIGLMEIQNNGYGELSAVRQLAAKLGNHWRVVDPGTSRLGGDAIAVAMIYDSRKVEPVGRAATLAIDDKNRQPLAQSFRLINGNKQALTVAVNHLKSKNCPDAANDDLD
ncbi:nuclease, partial [Xanthomonas citri pv. citri]